MRKPSKHTLRVAERILTSREVRPAVMSKNGVSWTIQWLDLKRLAKLAVTVSRQPTDGAAPDPT